MRFFSCHAKRLAGSMHYHIRQNDFATECKKRIRCIPPLPKRFAEAHRARELCASGDGRYLYFTTAATLDSIRAVTSQNANDAGPFRHQEYRRSLSKWVEAHPANLPTPRTGCSRGPSHALRAHTVGRALSGRWT